jgi:hypothetical protein
MNYKKIYDDMIISAKSKDRVKSGTSYYECHHIIPTSLGGLNIKENKVLLTAREHFVAHWLLYKICKGNEKYKMAHAWFLMSRISNNQERLKITSHKYKYMKQAHAIATSIFHKGKKLTEREIENRKYNNPNARRVIFNNVCFLSVNAAANYFNVTHNAIRKYLKNELPHEYIVDLNFRKKFNGNKISEQLKGVNKGKSYIELYGKEKTNEMIEKRRLAKLGNKHSDETRKKMSQLKIGKPSWNKGKKFNEESCKKMYE